MHRTSLHFIADIREALCAIQEFTEGMTCREFTQDRKTRDAETLPSYPVSVAKKTYSTH